MHLFLTDCSCKSNINNNGSFESGTIREIRTVILDEWKMSVADLNFSLKCVSTMLKNGLNSLFDLKNKIENVVKYQMR